MSKSNCHLKELHWKILLLEYKTFSICIVKSNWRELFAFTPNLLLKQETIREIICYVKNDLIKEYFQISHVLSYFLNFLRFLTFLNISLRLIKKE